MTLKEVCRFFGGSAPLHPATIYRGIGLRYPQPVKIGPNSNRWLRSECEAALIALADERQSRPAIKPNAQPANVATQCGAQAPRRGTPAKAKEYRRVSGGQLGGGAKLPTRVKTKRPKESRRR
jgi:predicted DNA-binding transcriptional regulator AlpA